MKLHLTQSCITIYVSEHSPFFLHVNTILAKKFSKSFWFKDILVNFSTHEELQQRKQFLVSLYYTCAAYSKTHNPHFLQRLIASIDKPIKIIPQKERTTSLKSYPSVESVDPYQTLEVAQTQSLSDIRKRYLHLAKKYHPDHIAPQESTKIEDYTERFQKIQEAYQAIKAQKSKKIAA